MPFVRTVELSEVYTQKSPSMSGSDKLHQDRIQRELIVTLNTMMMAIKEMQDYLETLP